MLYVPWRLLPCSGPQAVAQELLGGNRASRRCRARMRTDDSFQTCHTDGDGVVPVGNHFRCTIHHGDRGWQDPGGAGGNSQATKPCDDNALQTGNRSSGLLAPSPFLARLRVRWEFRCEIP